MKSKRGTETMVYHSLFSIIILILILGVFFLWLSTKTSDNMNPEITAKDLCLSTLAQKGTKIMVETDLIIEKSKNGFVIKKSELTPGYVYECNGNFDIEKVENKLFITIK
ncbi:MAG: hypothetical protein JSW08_01230 [archaeon]|nr:MAG: hypothetical protein JSW08_01230 [archaeon]